MSDKQVCVKVGDVFNETDDDEEFRVTSIDAKADPPTVLCVRNTKKDDGDESQDTEQEYALSYVESCVKLRREWQKANYSSYDVRDVYKMNVEQLRHALTCAKQCTKGNKVTLRRKLLFYLNIVEVPSDVESDSESDCKPPTKRSKTTKRRERREKSTAAAASAVLSDEDSCPELKDVSSSDFEDGDNSDSDNEDEADKEVNEPEPRGQQKKKKKTVASQKRNGGTRGRGHKRGTNKRKTRRGARVCGAKKKGKHHAVWLRTETDVSEVVRSMPEFSWRTRAPPRNTCATPFSTFRKVFFTDELIEFAVKEFNHYPKTLAAMRTRPPYIRKDLQWPPVWVNQEGRLGPMKLTVKEYVKYIAILYLLGVKGLQTTNLDDLFSTDPILREPWLCRVTNRHDLGRFLRQVRGRSLLFYIVSSVSRLVADWFLRTVVF